MLQRFLQCYNDAYNVRRIFTMLQGFFTMLQKSLQWHNDFWNVTTIFTILQRCL